jgi:rhodanese-related sulfurtransferase
MPVYSEIFRSALDHRRQAILISLHSPTELGLPILPDLKVVVEEPKNLGIALSPEILWFDGDGSLKQEWSGRLSPFERQQIDASIGGRALPSPEVSGDLSSSLYDRIEHTKPYTVIDVAERSLFAVSHRPSAINIPVAELFERARHEFNQQDTIFLDCSSVIAFDCDFAKRMITAEGFRSIGTIGRGKLVPTSCKAPSRGSPQ